MMALRLRQRPDLVDEGERFAEVRNLELAADKAAFLQQLPARRLRQIAAGLRQRQLFWAMLSAMTISFLVGRLTHPVLAGIVLAEDLARLLG
jgi:hypothetical protein